MQFQVPQFIEIEDKIFGPLTAKQFFYILGGGAIIFLLYVFFEFWLVIVLGAPVVALAGALAFLKVNGVPFVRMLNNAITYFFSNRLYIWKKRPTSARATDSEFPLLQTLTIAPRLTESKLQDLAWSLDIQHKPLNHRKT